MRTPILATSLIATALACGAGYLARGPGGAGLAPAAGRELAPSAVPPVDPALLPDEEEGVRVTPVVKAVRRAKDSVVSIYIVDPRRGTADGQGSGVILDPGGLVITNWHVVFRATGQSPFVLQARLKDNRQLPVRVISTSPSDDLALLQLDLPAGESVQPILLGDSSSLMIGETLIAIGNPQGHANTVTVGVLSAEERSIKVRAPDGTIRAFDGLLQTDAAINQGNSGGALLDITGKLIGINNAMAVSAENIGFAIPVDRVKRVFQEVLLSSDNLASVWLGLSIADGPDGHVVVDEVDPLGPAARAGLAEGDRILSAHGKTVNTRIDYARSVLEARPGIRFPLRVQRSGRTLDLVAVPLSSAAAELVQRIGAEVENVTRRDDMELVRAASLAFYGDYTRRVPLLPGVVRVVTVHPDSPAATLRLREGDILLGYGHQDWWGDYQESPFTSVEDMAERLRMAAGRTIPVIVLRGETVLEGKLTIRG